MCHLSDNCRELLSSPTMCASIMMVMFGIFMTIFSLISLDYYKPSVIIIVWLIATPVIVCSMFIKYRHIKEEKTKFQSHL